MKHEEDNIQILSVVSPHIAVCLILLKLVLDCQLSDTDTNSFSIYLDTLFFIARGEHKLSSIWFSPQNLASKTEVRKQR